jgi:sRNA-binding protein
VSDLTAAEIAERVATLARAREMFPEVFGDDPRPLAIGTGAGLRDALGVSKTAIDLAMSWWTTRPDYARSVAAPGSKRWNLDGTVAGDVSAEHRADAIEKLENPYGKPKTQQQQEQGPTVMTATVQTKAIKATVALEPSDIAKIKVPNSVSRVVLRVEVAGRALTAI